MLEGLEQRWVPSTLTVQNSLNSGAGSLRAAIADAQSGDTIVFAPSLDGQTIALSKGGELLIDKNLTIAGPGAGQLTVSGNKTSRVFEVATGMQVTLSGLTISNGKAVYGGGILNNGALTVSNSTVSGNYATVPSTKIFNEGGGIDNFGTLTVSNSTLSNNVTTGTGGGIKSAGNLTVTNSTVLGNTGGGIDCAGTTTTISGSTVSQNSAGAGAGIFNHSNTTLTITNSTVSYNTTTGTGTGDGGGILNYGTATISGSSTISDNTASEYGGGIYNSNGTLTITGSSLMGNSAGDGGGIFTQGRHAVNVNGGSILSGNTAKESGGGIYIYSGTLTVSGSTISNSPLSANSAGLAGGGIYVNTYATVTVENYSKIIGNSAQVGPGADVYNLGVLYLDSSSVIGILDPPL
jgi:hypothetical protein